MGKKIPANGIIFFIPAIITLPFGLFRRYFMDNFNNGIVCDVTKCKYNYGGSKCKLSTVRVTCGSKACTLCDSYEDGME